MTILYSTPVGDITHIPIIAGPTAVGKSATAMELAHLTSGNIFSCDAMQIYSDMNIGTAKASQSDREEIPHQLIDILRPNETYSVAQYIKTAYQQISDTLNDCVLPVFCGGTGQYISALYEGIEYVPIEISEPVRATVSEIIRIDNGATAYNQLKKVDPESAEKIHPNNIKRIGRALEVFHESQIPLSQFKAQSKRNGPKYPFKVFVLDMDRDILYQRINDRVDEMIDAGLEEEVRHLIKKYPDISITASQAIGYKEMIEYFQDKLSYDAVIDLIKQRTRNYAKRQYTWFRKIPGAIWIRPYDTDTVIRSITLNWA